MRLRPAPPYGVATRGSTERRTPAPAFSGASSGVQADTNVRICPVAGIVDMARQRPDVRAVHVDADARHGDPQLTR